MTTFEKDLSFARRALQGHIDNTVARMGRGGEVLNSDGHIGFLIVFGVVKTLEEKAMAQGLDIHDPKFGPDPLMRR